MIYDQQRYLFTLHFLMQVSDVKIIKFFFIIFEEIRKGIGLKIYGQIQIVLGQMCFCPPPPFSPSSQIKFRKFGKTCDFQTLMAGAKSLQSEIKYFSFLLHTHRADPGLWTRILWSGSGFFFLGTDPILFLTCGGSGSGSGCAVKIYQTVVLEFSILIT